MRRLAPLVLASVLIAATPALCAFEAAPTVLPAQGTLQAAFAPWDDIEGLIVDAIGGAKNQVLVQAYLFSNRNIAEALIAAHRRAVDVRVLADADQLAKAGKSKIPELAASGVAVWLETKYHNAHNKVIVIDAAGPDPAVITGSFNFTWGAQRKNAENILIARRNSALAARYALNWERHKADATPYRP